MPRRKRGSETRTLVVGADLFIGDRVITGPAGPGADPVLGQYQAGGRAAVRRWCSRITCCATTARPASSRSTRFAGTFRFVTGNAPKDKLRDHHADRHDRRARHGVRFQRQPSDRSTSADALPRRSRGLQPRRQVRRSWTTSAISASSAATTPSLIGNADDVKGQARNVMRRSVPVRRRPDAADARIPLDQSYAACQADRCGARASSIVDPSATRAGRRRSRPSADRRTTVRDASLTASSEALG